MSHDDIVTGDVCVCVCVCVCVRESAHVLVCLYMCKESTARRGLLGTTLLRCGLTGAPPRHTDPRVHVLLMKQLTGAVMQPFGPSLSSHL